MSHGKGGVQMLGWITDLFDFLDKIGGVLALLGGVFRFLLREKIKNYCEKDLLKEEARIKQELEIHKMTLMRELEGYKLNLDLKRSLQMEFNHRRFLAYHEAVGLFMRFFTMATAWGKHSIPPQIEAA
jgi:hypothetical protein